MAGFCRNCGSPLADAQGFCTKCGSAASGPPTRPAAQAPTPPAQAAQPVPQPQPPRAQAPAPAPQAAAAAPKKGMSTAVKVLLGFVIVLFVFGAVGIAGVWYLIHLGKEKAREMGLDQVSTGSNGPVLGGADPCSLLSKEDVRQAVKMEVVRAERTRGQEEGCQYSVMGNYPDMVASHLSLMQQTMMQNQKGQPTEAQKRQMDQMTKSFFHSMDAQQGNISQHPGESPVFLFGVSNAGAKAQMSMTRMAFGRMGPAFTELPEIGDEAFDVGGAMILARKGDKIVHVMYMMCPCARDDAVPLVRKIVGSL